MILEIICRVIVVFFQRGNFKNEIHNLEKQRYESTNDIYLFTFLVMSSKFWSTLGSAAQWISLHLYKNFDNSSLEIFDNLTCAQKVLIAN